MSLDEDTTGRVSVEVGARVDEVVVVAVGDGRIDGRNDELVSDRVGVDGATMVLDDFAAIMAAREGDTSGDGEERLT